MQQIKIQNRLIGDGNPVFIVADMAWSHDGSVENAKKIIKASSEAKTDAIKFHITSLEDYMVPQYGSGKGRVSAGKEEKCVYDYLKSINLDRNAWEELFQYAKKQDLLVVAMCNDLASLKFASKLNPDIYDVHSSCLSDEDFIKEVAKEMKPIFLGIGASTLGEIERAILWVKETGNDAIALMYGFQSYPTKLEDMHLRYIQSLKQIFSVPVGFADHTDGGSELALITPLVALSFGANIIEKHITHDRSFRGEDFESALNPADLKKLVHFVREIEKSFGSPAIRTFSQAELNYRQVSKKRAVAKFDINKNTKITKDMIAFKRSDEGVFPEESKFLIGRTAKFDIKKNEGLTWDKII
jgi:sialic acid synthase SpsE